MLHALKCLYTAGGTYHNIIMTRSKNRRGSPELTSRHLPAKYALSVRLVLMLPLYFSLGQSLLSLK